MAEDNIYTQDGTININRKPANKKKSGNWKACWFILGNECSERLAYYGMSTNLVNYLQAATAKSVNTWTGTYYITPLLGAFLADAYLGRYWTIASFSIIYVIEGEPFQVIAMVLAIIFFFGGSKLYRLQIPGGSNLTRICQVIVAASRKFSLQVPDDESLLHETVDVESVIKGSRKLDHTNYLRCLDKAAVETQLQALY